MLAKYWRLRGHNKTGETMTYNEDARISILLTPWKLGANGVITYGNVITEDLGFGAGDSIADDGESEGSFIDNTTNLYYGMKGYVKVIHNLATADGTFDIYLEESDDNVNWPSDQDSFDIEKHMILLHRLSVVNDAIDEASGANFCF